VRYWSPVNSPVLNPSGQMICVIHRVEEVTDRIGAEEDLESARISQAAAAQARRVACRRMAIRAVRL